MQIFNRFLQFMKRIHTLEIIAILCGIEGLSIGKGFDSAQPDKRYY